MEILNNISGRIKHNEAECKEEDFNDCFRFLLLSLFPIAPHICEIIFKENFSEDINLVGWPNEEFFQDNTQQTNIVVQVNGKVRANITAPIILEQREIEQLAKDNENVAKHLQNKNIIKVIFIKNKILNFVHS